MASVTRSNSAGDPGASDSSSENRKYVDLLNRWASEKVQERSVASVAPKEWEGKSTQELFLVLNGAQETRVMAYKAVEMYFKEFRKTRNADVFLNICKRSLEAFNDINSDIRLLQKAQQFDKRCEKYIDRLQKKEKEKFELVFNWYRNEASAVAAGGEGGTESIRSEVSTIEESITEILYELRSICSE